MTEPKPCPFCGNDKKELLSCSGGDDDIVICLDCLAENMRLNCWNTRPIEDALQERIVELEEAAMELLNSIPHSELEIARECIGNTNFSVITNCKHKLVRALRKDGE